MTACTRCPEPIRSDNASGLCRKCWQVVRRENNREEIRAWDKAYRRHWPERIMLSNAKQRARRAGTEFSITEDDIYIPVRCPLLGIEIRCNDDKIGPGSPSLDRIDPAVGYIPGNVQVISHQANRAKNNLTADQMDRFATNWLRTREGFTVIETIEISCPRCGADGPHERVGAAQDGHHVVVRCADNMCALEWKVAG